MNEDFDDISDISDECEASEEEDALFNGDSTVDIEALCSESSELCTDSDSDFSDQDIECANSKNSEITVTKDGTQWSRKKPAPTRRLARNILITKPGITSFSSNITTLTDAFDLFISQEILDILIEETNRRAISVKGAEWKKVHLVEMKAFIGLLILAGSLKACQEPILELWSTKNLALQRSIFCATMSRTRMKDLLRFIRFDNLETREERRKRSKLAAIEDIFNMFILNCKKAYNPDAEVCIDEQLVKFRGKCPFRVYMKSKPARYGMKIWTLCDVKTSYCWNMQVYTGKMNNVPEKEQGKRVVLEMVDGLSSGYGITADNFFTSLAVAKELLKEQKTITGTIKLNRKEVPLEFRPNRKRIVHSSDAVFSKEAMMVSYVPKRNRAVVMLSTKHFDLNLSDEEHLFKPQVILDYNHCKGSVDSLDRMVGEYTCSRNTKRWPLVLFFHMVDISAINAFIVFTRLFENYEKGKSFRRRLFLQDLGMALVKPLIATRQTEQLPKYITQSIRLILENVDQVEKRDETEPSAKRSRCVVCPRTLDKKTTKKCGKCNRFVCKNHVHIITTTICHECSNQN